MCWIGWTALGAGARSTCSWKMGAERHRELEKWSCQSGKMWGEESVLSLCLNKRNKDPFWTGSIRASTRWWGKKINSKTNYGTNILFLQENWNHGTSQLNFSYSYVCLDVLCIPQNSICCSYFSLNYCNWEYQDNNFLLNKTKGGIRIKCPLTMSMCY